MESSDFGTMSSAERGELACAFACVILAEENLGVSSRNIKHLLDATGIPVEPYLPVMFERCLGNKDIRTMMVAGGGAAAAAPVTSGGAPAEDTAKKAPEPESESGDDDLGFSLFD